MALRPCSVSGPVSVPDADGTDNKNRRPFGRPYTEQSLTVFLVDLSGDQRDAQKREQGQSIDPGGG